MNKKSIIPFVMAIAMTVTGMPVMAAGSSSSGYDISKAITKAVGDDKGSVITSATVFSPTAYVTGDKITVDGSSVDYGGTYTPSDGRQYRCITDYAAGDLSFVYKTAPLYEVQFSAGTAISPRWYLAGDTVTDLPDPDKEGFKGWEDSSGHIVSTMTMPEKDVTLTAMYTVSGELESYSIPALNPFANGTALDDIISALPTNATLKLSGESSTVGVIVWDTSDISYDPAKEDDQKFAISGKVSLPDGVTNPSKISLDTTLSIEVYAKNIVSHKLTFDLNGGTGTVSTGSYVSGASVTLPTDGFTYDKHTFVGWTTMPGATYTNVSSPYTMPDADTTLYAVWQAVASHTVSFDANGGTGTVPESITAYEDTALNLPFTNDLYNGQKKFIGWDTDKSATDPTFSVTSHQSAIFKKDVTLYAIYSQLADVHVSYNANGGSGTVPVDSATYTYGSAVTVLAASLTKDHYTFKGWSTRSYAYTADYAAGSSFTMPNSNVTLYAVWVPDSTYSVSYDLNGGSGAITDSSLYYAGDTVTIASSVPTRTHYTFKGWSQDKTKASLNAGDTFNMGTSNVILYAVWQEDDYVTLSYSANGGEGAPEDTNHYYSGDTVAVSFSKVPTRHKYVFSGWAETAGADTAIYTKSGVTSFAAAPTSTATIKVLYAVWAPETAKHINYDFNGVSAEGPVDKTNYYSGDVIALNYNVTPTVSTTTFKGWDTDKTVSEPKYPRASGKTVTMGDSDITLYAIYDTSTTLDGSTQVSFVPSTGIFNVTYTAGKKKASDPTYTWYKGTASVGTGMTYTPTSDGTYKCVLTDKTYTGTVTSNVVALYTVSKGDDITLDNSKGLYAAGNTVNAKCKVSSGTRVKAWSATNAAITKAQTNPTSFTMPASDVTLSVTTEKVYSVSIYGGVASRYTAAAGDKVSIIASSVEGKVFEKWVATNAGLADTTASSTSFTMPEGNVSITAVLEDESDLPQAAADAKHAVYTIFDNGGHDIKVYHHEQGPLCNAVFNMARGQNWLVTDYFNIVVDGSLKKYETDKPVKIQLNIPADIQKSGRIYKMICVSRYGIPYTIDDSDQSDSTITFTTQRFYAYAMCYSDPVAPVETAAAEETKTGITSKIKDAVTSAIHKATGDTASDSTSTPKGTSAIHSASEDKLNEDTPSSAADTDTGANTDTKTGTDATATNGAVVTGPSMQISSDKKDALNISDGAKVSMYRL
jgi:uncharacterized repeat protein (TIGR02543 family)